MRIFLKFNTEYLLKNREDVLKYIGLPLLQRGLAALCFMVWKEF